MWKLSKSKVMWRVDLQCRRKGGPTGPETRPLGLPWATRPEILASKKSTRLTDLLELIRDVHAKSVDRWQQGQAARPHLLVSGAPHSHEVQANSGVAYSCG